MKELLDVSAGYDEVKALYFLELLTWVHEVWCLMWAVFIHERCFIQGFDVWLVDNKTGPCFLVCCE